MKISEKWLRTWVDPPVTSDELVDQLTDAGLEVDGVQEIGFACEGVVVAEITDVEEHPTSQGLYVCNVDDGESQHQVVCGAPNTRKGLLTAYARAGGSVVDGTQIGTQSIHGVTSSGMLCSNVELGFGADVGKIVEFGSECQVGQPLGDVLDLDDLVLELDLTPNRGDCFSIRGVAREVAVANGLDHEEPVIDPIQAEHNDELSIELEDAEGCPKYLGRIIRNIDPDAVTPDWMAQRLLSAGLRPINPVVDVTNFVMLELGQPLHAFDLELVKNGIKVRQAAKGETLVLLDGKEVHLDSNVLLITDGTKPVAIAGVMGGEDSGIQPDTTDIFIECAYFNPLSIIGTARSFGIQTDASTRYERGVDYALQERAMERVTALLLATVGGSPGPVTNACEDAWMPKSQNVEILFETMDRLVGESVDRDTVTRVFEKLGLQPTQTEDRWVTTVPSHRFDIQIKEDLVEELVRVYGYNEVESRVPIQSLSVQDELAETRTLYDLKYQLAQLGYFESITYSFIAPEHDEMFLSDLPSLSLENPISEDRARMRKSLIPGLLHTVRYNLDRNQDAIRVFECGMCFRQVGNELQQDTFLAAILTGAAEPENWTKTHTELDFFDLKGDVESFCQSLGANTEVSEPVKQPTYLHPGQTASLTLDGREIGHLGKLHPAFAIKFDINQPVFVFEIQADALLRRAHKTLDIVSPFPSMRRDFALLLDDDVPARKVEQIARDELGEILEELLFFDVYRGEGIEQGKKSLAIGLTLRHPDKTLEEQEVNSLLSDLIAEFNNQLSAELR